MIYIPSQSVSKSILKKIPSSKKNIFRNFEKKFGKIAIFQQRGFSKSAIVAGPAGARIPFLQVVQKSYKCSQKNFKGKKFFCLKSCGKPKQKILHAKCFFPKISPKNTKKCHFSTFFFLKFRYFVPYVCKSQKKFFSLFKCSEVL